VLPGVIEYLRERKRNKQIAQQAESLKTEG
jgi:hypothetical protein